MVNKYLLNELKAVMIHYQCYMFPRNNWIYTVLLLTLKFLELILSYDKTLRRLYNGIDF